MLPNGSSSNNLERMGIKPGICKCCGGGMKVVKTMPNMFRASSRAPPANGIPQIITRCISAT